MKVRVVSALETFESEVQISDGTASIMLTGKLDETVTATLERDLERALAGNPQRVVLRAEQLESMSSAGARALLFLRQKLPFEGVDVYIVGAKPDVQEACKLVDAEEQSFVVRRRHQEAQAAEVAASSGRGGTRLVPAARRARRPSRAASSACARRLRKS